MYDKLIKSWVSNIKKIPNAFVTLSRKALKYLYVITYKMGGLPQTSVVVRFHSEQENHGP